MKVLLDVHDETYRRYAQVCADEGCTVEDLMEQNLNELSLMFNEYGYDFGEHPKYPSVYVDVDSLGL